MNINAMMQNNLASIRQSIGIATLRQAINQDAASVDNLLKGMDDSSKAIQRAAQPHRGSNIDITV